MCIIVMAVWQPNCVNSGAVLGDRVQIGCNAVTNPGTVLAPDSQVLPGTVVTGAHLKAGSKLPASPYLP